MELKYPNLFSPIKIRGMVFKNRVMSSPLGAWVFSPDNYTFDYAISMFEEKAKGGAASVCVGHTEINYNDEDSDGFGLYFDLRKREGTNALTTFAQALQQYGCHASVELNYGGLSMGDPGGPPEGKEPPKGEKPPMDDHGGPGGGTQVTYDLNMGGTPGGRVRPLTKQRIAQLISEYAVCVAKLRDCGFHMVTIHGAHGWMPAKFLSGKTNRRTDEYGGSLENRMRFPLQLMEAVRKAAGNRMVVEYRISGVDKEKDPVGFEEQVEFLNRLEGLADIIHISSGDMSDGGVHTFPSYLAPRGVNRKVAAALKQRVNIPIAVVGAISQPEMAEEIIKNGEADFVAMCRTLIADPQWPNKARRGQDSEIRPCIACYNCLDQMHKTHFLGCDINPRCGMEHRVPATTGIAGERKKVVIVGGGPAGMQAAITAADRGHSVTLIEKSDSLGGLLKISDGNGVKWMLNRFKNYLVRQVERRDITVLLNTEATAKSVEALNPDYVLVASGSMPIVPNVPGVDGENVFTSLQAHEREGELGDRVVLVGGNLVGCEEALHMKELGKKEVTVVEMTAKIHADAGMVANELDERLKETGVNIVKSAMCTKISPEGVTVQQNGKEALIPCDSVILAVGMRCQYEVFQSLLTSAPEVQAIGDCLQVGTVRNAVRTGFYTAGNI